MSNDQQSPIYVLNREDQFKRKLLIIFGLIFWLIGVVIIVFSCIKASETGPVPTQWINVINVTNGLMVLLIGTLFWIIASMIHLRVVIRGNGK